MQTCKTIVDKLPESLHFIKDGTVREWILASDMTASSYSTSLIEASIAEKPIYMFVPFPFPSPMYSEWVDLVHQVRSLEDFLEATDIPNKPTESNSLRVWAEGHMMSNGDAISNFAYYLNSIRHRQRYVPGLHDSMSGDSIYQQGDSNVWQHRIRKLLDLPMRKGAWRRTNHHEQDQFDGNEVTQRVSKWAEILR